jgi:hypothetical protein
MWLFLPEIAASSISKKGFAWLTAHAGTLRSAHWWTLKIRQPVGGKHGIS